MAYKIILLYRKVIYIHIYIHSRVKKFSRPIFSEAARRSLKGM